MRIDQCWYSLVPWISRITIDFDDYNCCVSIWLLDYCFLIKKSTIIDNHLIFLPWMKWHALRQKRQHPSFLITDLLILPAEAGSVPIRKEKEVCWFWACFCFSIINILRSLRKREEKRLNTSGFFIYFFWSELERQKIWAYTIGVMLINFYHCVDGMTKELLFAVASRCLSSITV